MLLLPLHRTKVTFRSGGALGGLTTLTDLTRKWTAYAASEVMTSHRYFGNEGESIPRDVEELLVHPLVQEIPKEKLVEIVNS